MLTIFMLVQCRSASNADVQNSTLNITGKLEISYLKL